jgi:hypothetical protein
VQPRLAASIIMQTSAPDREETPPFTTPDASMDEPAVSPLSPNSVAASNGNIDPLVAKAAKRIADVINDLRCELHQRDGVWAHAQGSLELALKTRQSDIFNLIIIPDQDGNEYPVTVQTTFKKPDVITIDDDIHTPASTSTARPPFRPTRRASDANLEKDVVSRKKRGLDHGDNESNKRTRTSEDEDREHSMPLITKQDLKDLLAILRENIQEDTSECVNHVQRLLRRFKEEWHEKSEWDSEQLQTQQSGAPFRNSVSAAPAGPGDSFPSPDVDREDINASVTDVVRQEAALISRQIKWVEDCRRVANDAHIKREDTWRTSSAGFHDQQRQDRENFQNRVIHESAMHSQMLNQILNEVKAIGLYAQNMKWELPTTHLNYMLPQTSTPPAFPTQPAQPSQPVRTLSSGANQPNQRAQLQWKTGRGPGTQNG